MVLRHGFNIPVWMCSWILTKNDEGAESKQEDEEEQHTHSNSFPRGYSWPVHLSWEAQSDPQGVVPWSNELLQPPGHPALWLFSFNASGHVHRAVVWVAGSVGIFIWFTYQHLVVAQWRQVLGSTGVSGRTSILICFAGWWTGVFLALSQHAFLPLVVLLLGEEVHKAMDVALRLVSQQ